MANYYPNFQIQTGLYTNGGEYVFLSNDREYIGPYYKTSQNRYFTGKDNTDPLSEEITPFLENANSIFDSDERGNKLVFTDNYDPTLPFISPEGITINDDYNKLTSYPLRDVSKYYPEPYTPLPTEEDYNNKQFPRYFLKRTNNLIFYEISPQDYQKYISFSETVMYNLFTPVSLNWVLTGEKEQVYNANKFSVSFVEKENNWYGFSTYLKNDYLKYYLAP